MTALPSLGAFRRSLLSYYIIVIRQLIVHSYFNQDNQVYVICRRFYYLDPNNKVINLYFNN